MRTERPPVNARRVLAPVLLGLMLGLVVVDPAVAQPATVQITADTSGESTRVLLTHSRRVGYAIRTTGGRLEVLYSQVVMLGSEEGRVEDALLKRYVFRDGRRLVMHLGEGYQNYESFELQNPFRLVIDLHGVRSSQAEVQARRKKEGGRIVVLDPGHGGVELGAEGPTGLLEKEVTLDLARRLRAALQRDSSISVVLTRDEDRILGLDERTAIANHNRADLFVSIHLNSSTRVSAFGAETYFLSNDATDDEARTVAALENRMSGVDEDSIYPEGGEAHRLDLVLWDLAQNSYLAESSLLGESVQRHLNELTGTRDRGVKQAPFRVLMGATMPAVLVEVGFISNPDEENRFTTDAYRGRVVNALTSAILEYLRNIEQLSKPEPTVSGEVLHR